MLDFINISVKPDREGKIRLIAGNIQFREEGQFRLRFLLRGVQWHELVSYRINVDKDAGDTAAGTDTEKVYCLA